MLSPSSLHPIPEALLLPLLQRGAKLLLGIPVPSRQQSGSCAGGFEKPHFSFASHVILWWLGETLVSSDGVIFSTPLGVQGVFSARVVWPWSNVPGSVRVFFSCGSASACWFWMQQQLLWLCRRSQSPFDGISNPAVTSALLSATGKAKTLMLCIPLKLSLSVSQQREGC